MVTLTVRGNVDVVGAVVIFDVAADTVVLTVRLLSGRERVEAVPELKGVELLVSVGRVTCKPPEVGAFASDDAVVFLVVVTGSAEETLLSLQAENCRQITMKRIKAVHFFICILSFPV